MGRVMKKGVSAILLFALVLTGCFAGLRLIAEAEVLVNVNITFEVSTTNVTNEPDNYGISYTLNDGDAAQNGTLNFKNDETSISLAEVSGSATLTMTLTSAGLSVMENGTTLAEDDEWFTGKTVAVTELTNKVYNFDFSDAGSTSGSSTVNTYTMDFPDATVSGSVATFDVDGTAVTLTSASDLSSGSVEVDDTTTLTLGDTFDASTMEVVGYYDDGFSFSFNVDNNTISMGNRSNPNLPNGTVHVKVQALSGNNGGSSEDGSDYEFNGQVYFVWRGENDALCVQFMSVRSEREENGEVYTNYIPLSSVTDNTTGEALTLPKDEDDYYWLYVTSIETKTSVGMIIYNSGFTTFSELQDYIESDEEVKRDIAIDPCNAVNGEKSICTNGNRMFRAMIYDDSAYEGVRFLADPNEYTYFPDFWDSTFYASEVDLVGSTRANPAVYESFLIEPTIHFGNSEASMEDIESVEALNVPSSVVTITKNASDGSFDVVFHSNFYVAVEFKITTTNETYYMTIQRTTLQVRDTNGEESTPHIVAKFYYTADDTYADYDIVATIYYTDGTKEIKILEPTSTDNDGGSNLKYATYSIEQNGVKGVAYTAVKAGALSGSTFGGVKAGAEEGYYFDCNSRKIVY